MVDADPKRPPIPPGAISATGSLIIRPLGASALITITAGYARGVTRFDALTVSLTPDQLDGHIAECQAVLATIRPPAAAPSPLPEPGAIP